MYTCLVKAIYLYTVTKGRQIFPNFEYLEDNFLNHCAQNVTYRKHKLREIKKKKNEEKFKLSWLRFLDEIRAIENLRGDEFKLKRKRKKRNCDYNKEKIRIIFYHREALLFT